MLTTMPKMYISQ